MLVICWYKLTSKKINNAIIQVQINNPTLNTELPCRPINLPLKPNKTLLSNGKKITNKYIINILKYSQKIKLLTPANYKNYT